MWSGARLTAVGYGARVTFAQHHSDEQLLAELRRVAALVDPNPVTVPAFDRNASASSATVRRRFGSWRSALDAARGFRAGPRPGK